MTSSVRLTKDEEQALGRVVGLLAKNGLEVSQEDLLLLLVKAAARLPDQELLKLVSAGIGGVHRSAREAT